MKKQMYGIIGLCSAVAVLGGGLAVLKISDHSDSDSGSSSVETTQEYGAGIVIVDDSSAPYKAEENAEVKGKVQSVRVKNEKSVLDAVIAEPAGESTSAVYTLKGYEDLSVDSMIVSTLFNNAHGLTSVSIIEDDCSELDKFGLADTAVEVEITYESGNKKKLYIGDSSPVTSNTYVRLVSSNTVYDVSSSKMSNYKEDVNYFIDKTVVKKLDDAEAVKILSLEIIRKDIEDEFLIEYDPASEKETGGGSSSKYILKKPVESYVKIEETDELVNKMFGLTANGIYALHCGESDIAGSGLSDPFCKAVVTCDDGKSYTLLLSETFKDEDGNESCYGMLEGGKIIYTFVPENVTWLTVTPADILSQNMILSRVWNLSKLDIKCGSTTESFTIEPKESGVDRTEAKKEQMSVKRNGTEFNVERFRQLYSFIIAVHAEEMAYNEQIPDTEPMVTLSYTDEVTKKSETYEFYEYSAMKCLIAVDGKSKFICSKSYVKTLIDNIGRVETGEEYVTSWKN